MLSLLQGDVSSYMVYNAMALPVATVFLAEWLAGWSIKHKRFLHVYSVVILTGNLVYYAVRMMQSRP